jgi:hypothetical protein
MTVSGPTDQDDCHANLISFFSLALSMMASAEAFTDPRDQQAYGVVEVAGMRWMTENLRLVCRADPTGRILPSSDS